ncbi:UbiA family prenyltransferase [Pelagibius sp. CAU 1746]|uniref:UbiA family prenyltransferase n=1 Tax=Pelagibius sp. CAU 1746 TaxID=3140370 RepID=UPI00325AC49B
MMTARRVLVVDLDGTLVHTDMLFETFWAAFAKNWATPFLAVRSFARGRAALKRKLCELGAVDIASLPYNEGVIGYVRRWRAEGGRAALVTASDRTLAEEVASHLGIFDEVHGSDGETNLKGTQKAEFLEERFGHEGFVYIGDAAADIPVWEKAEKAVTVNLPRAVKARVDALGRDAEHLVSRVPSIKPYVKALRVHQWLKNLLVFVPMMTAHQFNLAALGHSLLAFIAFSFVASSVYVLNDLLDLSSDRAHPRNRNRPFASGTIPIGSGVWLAPLLLLDGLAIASLLGESFLLVLAAYYAATLSYSLYFKRRIVIDICLLAGLYTMRIIAGATATGITLSVWLLAFSIFFFFALAAVKRQAELVNSLPKGEGQALGRGYRAEDLPLICNTALAAGFVSVLVMALYVNSPAVLELYGYPQALWGVCLVLLYWISRIVMVTHRGQMHDDPVVFAVRDSTSLLCLLIILAFAAGGMVL